MENTAIQFGERIESPLERVSAYGVILNDASEILVVEVKGKFHLPGGGIDPGEDACEAIKREALEETGYAISDLELIGKANQYLPNASMGSMNKLGTFYKAKALGQDVSKRVESDHLPRWVTHEEIKEALMSEFYKWAVDQVFDSMV